MSQVCLRVSFLQWKYSLVHFPGKTKQYSHEPHHTTVFDLCDTRRTCKATIRLNTSSLILSSTSNSDSCLSASVLAARTSLDGHTYWGKSRTWRDAMGTRTDPGLSFSSQLYLYRICHSQDHVEEPRAWAMNINSAGKNCLYLEETLTRTIFT